MKIEVLFFQGCPNHPPAVEQVRKVLSAEGIEVPIHEVEITDSAMAQRLGFLGSPSVRIDELDIEPEARGLRSYGFGCRTYAHSDGRRSGLPPLELIQNATRERLDA